MSHLYTLHSHQKVSALSATTQCALLLPYQDHHDDLNHTEFGAQCRLHQRTPSQSALWAILQPGNTCPILFLVGKKGHRGTEFSTSLFMPHVGADLDISKCGESGESVICAGQKDQMAASFT